MSDTLYGDLKQLWTKVVTTITVGIVVVISMIGQCVEKRNINIAREGFENHNFLYIALIEHKKETIDQCTELFRGIEKSKPITEYRDSFILRKVFKPKAQVADLPLFAYLETSELQGDYKRYREPNIKPIYVVFKGKDAVAKTQQWCKQNGYPDFELKWREDTHHVKMTVDVELTKRNSTLWINAMFESRGNLYGWNGRNVDDYNLSVGRGDIDWWVSLAK